MDDRSDMQWRRANGTIGTYTGPLVQLGVAIPRNLPDHGIRRATYDLAFGYVSGFPVRDIIPFAIRSLFPTRTAPVTVETEAADLTHVGTAYVQCPACDEVMPATVTAEITEDDDGTSRLACDPDMTDIWAHMWTHQLDSAEA